MTDKKSLKPVAFAVGAALAGSFALGSAAYADTEASPFAMTSLSSGYMLGIVGEGSCGGDKEGDKDKAEGACGEGSCGGDKAEGDDKGEGHDKDKTEGACGEGSCGGDKAEGEDKDKSEGSCGGSI